MGRWEPRRQRARQEVARACMIIGLALQSVVLLVHVAGGSWWQAALSFLSVAGLAVWLVALARSERRRGA